MTPRLSNLSTAVSIVTGHDAMRCAPFSTRPVTGAGSCRRLRKPLLRKDWAHDRPRASTHQAFPVSAYVRDPKLEPILLQARDLAAHCTNSLRGRKHAPSTPGPKGQAAVHRGRRHAYR